MKPLLAIMNPRQIPACIASLEALHIRRAWLQNYSEWQLQEVIDSIVRDETIDFTHLVLVSDDCVVSQGALDAVLKLAPHHPVVTGWCRLDETSAQVNLCYSPLVGDTPREDAYDFMWFDEVAMYHRSAVPTHFVGFALTCMSREMWTRFPFRVFGNEHGSFSSDFNLSIRLRDAVVPMVAARAGYVHHYKKWWNVGDPRPETRLLVGERPARTEVDR